MAVVRRNAGRVNLYLLSCTGKTTRKSCNVSVCWALLLDMEKTKAKEKKKGKKTNCRKKKKRRVIKR